MPPRPALIPPVPIILAQHRACLKESLEDCTRCCRGRLTVCEMEHKLPAELNGHSATRRTILIRHRVVLMLLCPWIWTLAMHFSIFDLQPLNWFARLEETAPKFRPFRGRSVNPSHFLVITETINLARSSTTTVSSTQQTGSILLHHVLCPPPTFDPSTSLPCRSK